MKIYFRFFHHMFNSQNAKKVIEFHAHRGDAEVAGWTLDWKNLVRFPAYPHRVWALWWQGGKRRLWTSRCPCRGRLGRLKSPSCPWRGFPAAGQNLETGHLFRHYISRNIAECDVKPQSTTLPIQRTLEFHSLKKNCDGPAYPNGPM